MELWLHYLNISKSDLVQQWPHWQDMADSQTSPVPPISMQLSFGISRLNINTDLTTVQQYTTPNFTQVLIFISVGDQAVDYRVLTAKAGVNPTVTKFEKTIF